MIAGVWDPRGVAPGDERRCARALGVPDPAIRSAGPLVAAGATAIDGDGWRVLDGPAGYTTVTWRAGEAVLACDPLGRGGLYVRAEGGRVVFATALRALLDLGVRTPDPDRHAVARWLAAGTLPASEPLLAGVTRLAPGEAVALRTGRRHLTGPTPGPPLRIGIDEAAARARESVLRAVERRCPGGRKAAVLLSGGLDSSIVAGVAAVLPPDRRPRALYSVLFPGLAGTDETLWIETVARELGLPSVRMSVRGGSIVGGMLDWTARWGSPLAAPTWFYQRPLMERIAADGAEVVLDGEGGDELFTNARFLVADRVRAGRPLAALRLVRRFPGAGPDASRRVVARVFAEYGIRGALPGRGDWRRPGPRWRAHLIHQLTTGIAEVGAHEHFRLRAAAARLRADQPLRDLALTELVLALPPELAFDPERDRPVLRRAMTGMVPSAVLDRRGKARFEPLLVGRLTGSDLPAIRALAGENAQVRPHLPPGWAPDPPAGRPAAAWADVAFRVASAECWLQWLADRAFPGRSSEQLALPAPELRFELFSS